MKVAQFFQRRRWNRHSFIHSFIHSWKFHINTPTLLGSSYPSESRAYPEGAGKTSRDRVVLERDILRMRTRRNERWRQEFHSYPPPPPPPPPLRPHPPPLPGAPVAPLRRVCLWFISSHLQSAMDRHHCLHHHHLRRRRHHWHHHHHHHHHHHQQQQHQQHRKFHQGLQKRSISIHVTLDHVIGDRNGFPSREDAIA